MPTSNYSLQRHSGIFLYAGKSIPFHFWSHTARGHAPDTIIFLGTAQVGRLPKWAAAAAPGTVVVEGAPHWQAHPSARDLYEFMYGYTEAAFKAIVTDMGISSPHLIAQSQAAPGVVRLGLEHPDSVGNIVLLAPLGFAAQVFGGTPEERYRTLVRRARRSLLQKTQLPFHDPRNLYAGYKIASAILRESERGASRRKYAKGLSYDMLEDCRALTKLQAKKGMTCSLLLGEKDKIFTAHEIPPLVDGAGITGMNVHILPGVSHLTLAVRAGRNVIRAALDLVRS